MCWAVRLLSDTERLKGAVYVLGPRLLKWTRVERGRRGRAAYRLTKNAVEMIYVPDRTRISTVLSAS